MATSHTSTDGGIVELDSALFRFHGALGLLEEAAHEIEHRSPGAPSRSLNHSVEMLNAIYDDLLLAIVRITTEAQARTVFPAAARGAVAAPAIHFSE